jgi:hypothetical protein
MADIRNRDLTLADCRFDWTFHGYDSSFPGTATFSDIDGIVHINGHFLFIELKSMKIDDPIPQLSKGQRAVYEALGDLGPTTCLFIAGDMQKSVPYYVEDLVETFSWDLRSLGELGARDALRDIIKRWSDRVTANKGR